MNAGFVFVNEDPAKQDDHRAARKQVRSHAAAYSHRTAPRRGTKAAKYQPRVYGPTSAFEASFAAASASVSSASPARTSISSQSTSDTSATSVSSPGAVLQLPTKRQRTAVIAERPPVTSPRQSHASHGGVPATWRVLPPLPSPPRSPGQRSPKSPTQRLVAARKNYSAAKIGRKRSHSRSFAGEEPAILLPYGRLPDPAYMDSSSKDPFSTYPVPYKSWFGWLLDFWYSGILPRSNRLVKVTTAQMSSYITWSRAFEITEPALYYTSLFLATGIPVSNGQLGIEKALWLRGMAVKALNEALSDPRRATSNAVISAVGKVALHEHIYGDRQASHRIHRPAQQRMIAMRGGVERLGLPAITLQLMVWYDALMAAESGTTAYFADLPDRLDLKSFAPNEAVQVTNESSPHRNKHPGYDQEWPNICVQICKPAMPLIVISTSRIHQALDSKQQASLVKCYQMFWQVKKV
ncbi:hypothetical protein Tdes44962_MAKER02087 [Teratosphaeria destructans]|uniref:Uncharacterized protein n=1 Tax=Teratosphaeria destructans TaxID=418781 RepID=A0A9W7SVC6_9PEZI|nr:hypothetical protein Tdes44962_MAKER02087 [Teratosphaeria destructans]